MWSLVESEATLMEGKFTKLVEVISKISLGDCLDGGLSGWLSDTVRVSSRAENVNTSKWANVFDNVFKGSFVLFGGFTRGIT